MNDNGTDPKRADSQPEVSPEVQRRADRTVFIIYIVMAVLILLPFLMLLFRKNAE